MNQILETSNVNQKSKRKGPAEIKTIVRVFAIMMIIFGICMIATGTYAIYKDNGIKDSGTTKPTITETLKDEKTVLLTIRHDKAIDKVEYGWSNGKTETITGNGRKYIEQEIKISGGKNTLTVKATDVQGQEITSEKEYTANDIIKLAVSGGKMKITAENDVNIAYMTYRWDEEEERKIDINSKNVDQEIDIPMGEHILTVILVDENNETTTKEQTVKGVTKPTIEVSLDENKENYVIKITDTSDIKQVDIQLRGQNKTITPEAGKKELKYKLKLKAGDENYLEVTAQNTEGISSGTRKIKYKKQ